MTKGENMQIEIRTSQGKKLFEWNPTKNTITIMFKKHCYCIELNSNGTKHGYNVIEINR